MSTKMGEYLSTGVPVIYCGPSSIAMTEFLKSKNCAIIVEQSGDDYMRNAIIRALENSDEIKEMCNKGIELAKSYFNIEAVSRNFANILKNTL